MKEHPILFSGPMVRAILDGRKTQTRRLMMPAPASAIDEFRFTGIDTKTEKMCWTAMRGGHPAYAFPVGSHSLMADIRCPYGKPGDLLWVRETLDSDRRGWRYAADSVAITMSKTAPDYPAMISWAHHQERNYCPSIHMPRWASRITLEVTSVRVERVHSLSEEDASAEGMLPFATDGKCRTTFEEVWDQINGKRAPWSSNPWVWVIGFKREYG